MENKDRILEKLVEMNKYLDELESFLPTSNSEYKKEIVPKRASEKTIELAIECVYDIMAMIIASEKFGMPSDEESFAAILAKNKVITAKLATALQGMRGFRNLLVHRYAKIDDVKAYRFLSGNIDDFAEFERQIVMYLKGKK